MGVLWLLSVAIICHSTRVTTAWPEGNSSEIKHSELTINKSIPLERQINKTIIVRNNTYSSDGNIFREKRGTRFSSWAGKRGEDLEEEKRAKFSSWGGKRADDDEIKELYESLNNVKRAKFSSWGGKRSYTEDEPQKRAKFSSWGGKRSYTDDPEKRAKFSSWAGKRDPNNIIEDKRTKFNSWAGKREDLMGDKRAKFSSWAGKRGKFNSWAGKRSDSDITLEDKQDTLGAWDKTGNSDQNKDYFNEDKRAKFSSWAGKRDPSYQGGTWNKIPPDSRVRYYSGNAEEPGSENIMKLWQDFMSRKRARFSSWAGKRSEEIVPDMESLVRYLESEMQEPKRAKFSSWAGKREDPEKRKFNSWGGKRNGNVSYDDSFEEKEEYPSMIVKRSVFSWNSPSLAYKRKPVFSSWGGKRSDGHTIQARSIPMRRLLINGGKDRTWSSLMRPIRRGPDFYAWGGKRST